MSKNSAEEVARGLAEEGDLESAIRSVATQIKYLGNGNAATPMGAIEAHGLAIKESSSEIASAIGGLDAIGEGLDKLARAVEDSSHELAIDGLSSAISEGFDKLAKAIQQLAEALNPGGSSHAG